MDNKLKPIVSVGMPIRNGIDHVQDAIESILKQTEKNIEIIISDNNSEDGTSQLLYKLAKKDNRIRYFRHKKKLKAFQNFLYVLSKARGKFFMWAAHDDTRSLNYIENLKNALEEDAESILAFGDLYITTSSDLRGKKVEFNFSTYKMNIFQRLKKLIFIQIFYIYGLWKTEFIKNTPYIYCSWWPDLPLMLSASCKGHFIHVPETRFFYREIKKTSIERIKYQDYETKFNLILGVLNLIKSCFLSTLKSGGVIVGIYVLLLVITKQLINFPHFIINKIKSSKLFKL